MPVWLGLQRKQLEGLLRSQLANQEIGPRPERVERLAAPAFAAFDGDSKDGCWADCWWEDPQQGL